MKTLLIGFLLCGICAAHQDPPKLIRVSVQFIELPHSVLTEWMSADETNGAVMHANAMALTKTGGAKVLETSMVVSKTGQKATVESIREEIFPTEVAPPTLPGTFSGDTRDRTTPMLPIHPMLRAPTAFETRNTGVTLEVEPTIGENDPIIALRLNSEIVSRLRLETWMEHWDPWGNAPIRMPIFETWGSQTSLTLRGEFELAAVIIPKSDAPVPAVSRRILLFVRADILPAPRSR